MMLKNTVLASALAVAFGLPLSAHAAESPELAAIRAEIAQMKQSYEARLQSLEQRLQDAQAATAEAQNAAIAAQQAAPAQSAVAAPEPVRVAQADNSFNPSISLVLGGSFNNLQRDPETYRFGGFMPSGGEIGPGGRSFNLGESELTMSANIDPMFAGQLTFALTSENEAEVEEAFITTRALGGGWNLKAGRFMSGVGYMNGQHSHAWDFVDAPLAYQAFFGGQYKPDGVQARWLAPLNTFVELGAEVGSGRSFPGSDRNKNGFNATSVFAHIGDDIGESSSWRAGVSYLRSGAAERDYEDEGIENLFSGKSSMWIADAVYKWAPNGNPTQQNFKLQGEYMRRTESGTLAVDDESGNYRSRQSGWYLQSVYQFMPNWRVGARYDRLDAGNTRIGLVEQGVLDADLFPALARYRPSRSSVMLDWSPSEFSRLRLQWARDRARPDGADNQISLQYIMSLGTHAGHSF